MLILKLFTAFFLLIPLFSSVSAQSSSVFQIPGVDCGMANTTTATKCCYQKYSLPGGDIVDLAKQIPIVGSKISVFSDINDSLERVQDKYAIRSACFHGTPSTLVSDPSCQCVLAKGADEIKPITDLCNKYKFKSPNELTACANCAKGGGFWSGMGCVPLRLENFISSFLLSFGVGLGGFIALLCIVYSAIIMQTSGGNPEKLKKAQENITSCILGLILIIFSIFILRLIGVEILGIPFLR